MKIPVTRNRALFIKYIVNPKWYIIIIVNISQSTYTDGNKTLNVYWNKTHSCCKSDTINQSDEISDKILSSMKANKLTGKFDFRYSYFLNLRSNL